MSIAASSLRISSPHPTGFLLHSNSQRAPNRNEIPHQPRARMSGAISNPRPEARTCGEELELLNVQCIARSVK